MTGCRESDRQAFYRAILDAVEQPLIVTGASGLIVEFNAAAERLTGYAAAEVMGLPLSALGDASPALAGGSAPSNERDEPSALEALVEAGTHAPRAGEWTLIRKDGARRRVDVRWSILRSASGAVDALLLLPHALPERDARDWARAAPAPAVALAVAPRALGRAAPLDRSAPLAPCFARAEVLRRLGGDSALLTEIAELFQRERAALGADLRRALEARDPSAVERRAHRLRSALLNLAAGPAAQAALRLEDCGRRGHLPEPEQVAALFAELERLSAALPSCPGAWPCAC